MTDVRLAALRHGLLVDDGDGWALDDRFDDHSLECVAAGEAAFCGTYDAGLFRRVDGTWEGNVLPSDAPDHVMSIAVDPHDPATVWVGTEPSRVYRSADGGDTWRERPGLTDLPSAGEWSFPPRPDTHHVRWIEPDPNDRGQLYVGIEAGALVRTADGGETWIDRPEGARRDNHQIATHPDAPDRVYAAAGDGYAESLDGGDTWRYPQEGLEHRYVWSVAVDAGDPDVVLAAGANGARNAHTYETADAHVYRRTDGAWHHVDGLPHGEGVLRAVLASAEAGQFHALTNRGLYRSTDAGRSWSRVDTPWREAFERQTPRGLRL